MNYKLELNPNATLTKMNGQSVLFSKKSGDFFGLNECAAIFVDGLIKSDFETTVSKAASDFAVTPDELRTDIEDLVNSLAEMNLARRVPAA